MSAIGGCWWPLGFEPSWMRVVAGTLPTTWAMQAFNDLMIRHAPPSAALRPFAVTIGLGAIYLALGLAANARRRT
jgi:ABC-type multidrug transport system permease subunit